MSEGFSIQDAQFIAAAEAGMGLDGIERSDSVFGRLKGDRQAGVALLRELCFRERVVPEGFDSLMEDVGGFDSRIDYSMLSPAVLSCFGYDWHDRWDEKVGSFFERFRSVVPEPFFSDDLNSYLSGRGVGPAASMVERLSAVLEAGDGAVRYLVGSNLDAFVSGLDRDTYESVMRNLSYEKEASDVLEAVVAKQKSGEVGLDVAVSYLRMKERFYPETCFNAGNSYLCSYTLVNDSLMKLTEDGPFDMPYNDRKATTVVRAEQRQFVPGAPFRTVFLVTSKGAEFPFVAGDFSFDSIVNLAGDVSRELDNRRLVYMHVTKDNVDDLVSILRKHGVQDVMGISVGSFGNGGRFVSVDGVRTAVPDEGLYVVYNRNFRAGVYTKAAFDSLFEKTSQVDCTPRRVARQGIVQPVRKKDGRYLS